MSIEKILVVDDEPLMRSFLVQALERKRFDITSAESVREAFLHLKERSFDLIISDMKLKDGSGLEILQRSREHSPSALFVVITAFGTIENAVEAMRKGAFHYLLKPFTLDALDTIIQKATDHLSLLEENAFFKSEQTAAPLIAESPIMQKMVQSALKIAKSNASVWIEGESGTGKEVMARLIHSHSHRGHRPYIRVNCAAIPEALVESEFFGHEKGAFTGANNKRLGRFELAHLGTLLLDEITETPLTLQPKLLRAIQEQEFERVGGSRTVKVDVRLIATTNRSIKEMIAQKQFREDLFYRLNVVPLHLPPLRERREDILPLAEYFLKLHAAENHKKLKKFSEKAKTCLLSYDWPGNIRELSNAVERSVVLETGSEVGVDVFASNS